MILFHGSYMTVNKPDLDHSRNLVDFGKGFYVTPIFEQAKNWCNRYKKLGQQAIVSIYNLDESCFRILKLLNFEHYSLDWLEFVVSCRKGLDKSNSNYDVVIGGVANDRVFNTVELYLDGLIDKQEAIGRLRQEEINLQIAFRSELALSYLTFEGRKNI